MNKIGEQHAKVMASMALNKPACIKGGNNNGNQQNWDGEKAVENMIENSRFDALRHAGPYAENAA